MNRRELEIENQTLRERLAEIRELLEQALLEIDDDLDLEPDDGEDDQQNSLDE